jgi:hypothetical protein
VLAVRIPVGLKRDNVSPQLSSRDRSAPAGDHIGAGQGYVVSSFGAAGMERTKVEEAGSNLLRAPHVLSERRGGNGRGHALPTHGNTAAERQTGGEESDQSYDVLAACQCSSVA